MAEEIAYSVADWLLTIGAEEAAGTVLAYGATAIEVGVAIGSVYTLRENQKRQQRAALDAYNSNLKDRYVMSRSSVEPRRFVLGRQRVSGPLAYIGSYGADREHLVFACILAAHEVDAIETIYFDDEQVTLDGGGNVTAVNRRDLFTLTTSSATFTLTSAPKTGTVTAVVDYGTTRVTLTVSSVSGTSVDVTGGTAGQTGTVTISYQPATSPWVPELAYDELATGTLDGTGSFTFTAPTAITAVYSWANFGTGDSITQADVSAYTSFAGNTITFGPSPLTPGQVVNIPYRRVAGQSRARVRMYRGAPGQTADAGMIAALPGIWTSAHTMTGLAYLVVECDYDPDAFPGGLINASAVVRGAKLYDPRTGSTAWSENPALMMRWVATHPLLGNLSTTQVADASIIAAANVCDTSASYVVGGQTYTRALYKAGYVAKSGLRAKDMLDDLAAAMAGRWTFAGGQLRVKAGSYVTPLQTLDESWLSDKSSVQVQPQSNRSDMVNVFTGRFLDEQRDYVERDYPRVDSTSYITADGRELPQDLPLNAVTFVGQAQQVVACRMRDARLGMRVVLTCNMRAFRTEVFDTILVTLARFGWSAKPFEVVDRNWTLDGGIQLTLKATDPSIWAMGTSFSIAALPPNTLFASPVQIPDITGLTCASGTAQLLKQADGTVQSRILVTWTPVTDAFVAMGGGVEVRYGPSGLPESKWQSIFAESGQARVYISNVQDGAVYLVKARAFTALVSDPTWCPPVTHPVVGKTALPANVSGLATSALPGGVGITVTPSTEIDVITGGYLELRVGGANWAGATRIFRGVGDRYTWPWPSAGTYTLRAKWVDSSGNESATDATTSVTVGTGNLIDAGQIKSGATTQIPSALTVSSISITAKSGTGSSYSDTSKWTAVGTLTWTADVSGIAKLAMKCNAAFAGTVGTGTVYTDKIQCYVQINVDFDNNATSAVGEEMITDYSYAPAPNGTAITSNRALSVTQQRSVTAGTTYTWPVYAKGLESGVSLTLTGFEFSVELPKN